MMMIMMMMMKHRIIIMAVMMTVSNKKCNGNLFIKSGLKRCREIPFGRFYFSTLFCISTLRFFSSSVSVAIPEKAGNCFLFSLRDFGNRHLFLLKKSTGIFLFKTIQWAFFSSLKKSIFWSEVQCFAFWSHHSRISHFPLLLSHLRDDYNYL